MKRRIRKVMSIDVRELRLGNIIAFEGMKAVIKEIDEQGVVVFIEETYETEWIDLFQFTPIPLTEEILLKCGFDLFIVPNEYHNREINEGAYYVKPVGDALKHFYLFHKQKIITSNIRYLHQLQNLYFELTNKELEINLYIKHYETKDNKTS